MWVPFLKTIYGVSKQVVSAFIDPNRVTYKSVVLVDFPQLGVRMIGFITGKIEDTGVRTAIMCLCRLLLTLHQDSSLLSGLMKFNILIFL